MAMDVKGPSGRIVEVNTDNELQVGLTQDYEKAGYVNLACESGQVNGSRYIIPLEASEDFRLRVGVDTPLFQDCAQSVYINSSIYKAAVTTMTVSNLDGTYILNNNNSTASGAYASLQTWRTFPLYKAFSLYGEAIMYITGVTQTNQDFEFGFFNFTGVVDPTDGAFFRLSGSNLYAVVAYNSTEIMEPIDIVVTPNNAFNCIVEMSSDRIKYWINYELVATIEKPANRVNLTSKAQLPLSIRTRISGVVAVANQLRVGLVSVSIADMNTTKDWGQIMSGMGKNLIQYPNVEGSQPVAFPAPPQTSNNVNSTVPATRGLSNTSASYTTLGGKFLFAAVDGLETDYALFAIVVPTGNNAFIRSIDIGVTVLGAAIATTATVMEWSLGVGASAVSLATNETATAKAPRKITLGNTAFKVGEAIGTYYSVSKYFSSGIFVGSNEFIHVILRIPVGTATGSQTFRGHVSIDGYWE